MTKWDYIFWAQVVAFFALVVVNIVLFVLIGIARSAYLES